MEQKTFSLLLFNFFPLILHFKVRDMVLRLCRQAAVEMGNAIVQPTQLPCVFNATNKWTVYPIFNK